MRASRWIRPLTLSALVLPALLLAACGSDDDGEGGDTGNAAEENPCAELIAEASALEDVGAIGDAESIEVAGVQGCRAGVSDSDYDVVDVQVVQTPAADWAKGLPQALDQVLENGGMFGEENLKKLREGRDMIESEGGLDDAGACDFFTTVIEILQGAEKGAQSTVNSVPTEEEPFAVNGQACSEGTYTSVQVENTDGVQPGTELQGIVESALGELHPSPLG